METITYCDIYNCKDCPKYGDDCDGEIEEDGYITPEWYFKDDN